jgi:hypothetical protein
MKGALSLELRSTASSSGMRTMRAGLPMGKHMPVKQVTRKHEEGMEPPYLNVALADGAHTHSCYTSQYARGSGSQTTSPPNRLPQQRAAQSIRPLSREGTCGAPESGPATSRWMFNSANDCNQQVSRGSGQGNNPEQSAMMTTRTMRCPPIFPTLL